MKQVQNISTLSRRSQILRITLSLTFTLTLYHLPKDVQASPLQTYPFTEPEHIYQSSIFENGCEHSRTHCMDSRDWLKSRVYEVEQPDLSKRETAFDDTLSSLSRFSFSVDERRRPMIHYMFYIDTPGPRGQFSNVN
jgi:hypothetical protein